MTSSSSTFNITTIQFALHPTVTLRVTLHRSIHANPHQVVNKLLDLPENTNSEKFAIFDATRIISLDQIAVAANSALLRQFQFQQKNGSCGRGLALETILCCAGSTNTGSVLKDYAFDKHSIAASQSERTNESHDEKFDVLCIGYCSSDQEFEDVVSTLGLSDPEPTHQINEFLSRTRTDKEIQDLMKVYKITNQEVDTIGSSLEKAINNRVAAKFHV